MRAFGKGIWGEVADRTVELLAAGAGVFLIVYRSHFSLQRAINWQSLQIVFTVLAGLVAWHGFRSAYGVSSEIAKEHQNFGFTGGRVRPSFQKLKLYSIAGCLTFIAFTAATLSWLHRPPANEQYSGPLPDMSLKTRAVNLAEQLFNFVAERESRAPSDESERVRYDKGTIELYKINYLKEVEKIRNELAAQGLVNERLDSVYKDPHNSTVIRYIAEAIGSPTGGLAWMAH